MKNSAFFMVLLFCVCSCSNGTGTSSDLTLVSTYEGGKLYKAGPVRVLELHGTHYQMGRQYGALLKDDLSALYDLTVSTFAAQGFTYDRLKQTGDFVYAKYPQVYKDVIIGMAETSGLGMDKQIVLNALEWIPKINVHGTHCSGIAVWGDYTAGGPLIFGRNNDDTELYKTFGGYTMVAVFNPTDSGLPVAIVNYAGVIYAPSGMNRDGIFLELNSGNAQGFYRDRQSIVVTLFSFLEKYSTQEQLNAAFQTVSPDLSSIVTEADENTGYSFECSTSGVVRRRGPDAPGLLVATNHFVDPSWGIGPPVPDKDNGWTALRRDNLLTLAAANKGSFDAAKMMQVMDTTIAEGGATQPAQTIYQIIAVPKDRTLWLKAPPHFDWQKIDLRALFAESTAP